MTIMHQTMGSSLARRQTNLGNAAEAIVEQLTGKAVDWMEKVSDDQYFTYKQPEEKDIPPAGKQR